MREGRADLAFTGSRAWDEFGAKRLRALDAPLLIDSYRLEERVLTSKRHRSDARGAASPRPRGDRHPAGTDSPAVRRVAPLAAPGDFSGRPSERSSHA